MWLDLGKYHNICENAPFRISLERKHQGRLGVIVTFYIFPHNSKTTSSTLVIFKKRNIYSTS